MNKRNIISITTAVCLLSLGGYFLYNQYYKNDKKNDDNL